MRAVGVSGRPQAQPVGPGRLVVLRAEDDDRRRGGAASADLTPHGEPPAPQRQREPVAERVPVRDQDVVTAQGGGGTAGGGPGGAPHQEGRPGGPQTAG